MARNSLNSRVLGHKTGKNSVPNAASCIKSVPTAGFDE
jgi:hypothetical protein